MTMTSQAYAHLSDHSYGRDEKGNPVDLPSLIGRTTIVGGIEYRVLESVNKPSGYQGTIYQRVDSGEIIVAHRGTEGGKISTDPAETLKDIKADVAMVTSRANSQSGDAIELVRSAQRLAETYAADSKMQVTPVTVTGHSLGGVLAQISAHYFDLKGETFNSFGAASLILRNPATGEPYRLPEGGSNIVNHVMAGDFVSAASPHFGQTRVYTNRPEVATLTRYGYENDNGVLDQRSPFRAAGMAAQGGSHDMHNFLPWNGDRRPDTSLLENPASRRLAAQLEPLIDQYREDISAIRGVASVASRVRDPLLLGTDLVMALRDPLPPGEPARREQQYLNRRGASLEESAPPDMRNPGHPANGMYRQAFAGVEGVDRSMGRTSDASTERLAASLTAAGAGLADINQVALSRDGSRAFAMETARGPAEAGHRVDVAVAAAVQRPVEDSTRDWQDATQRIAQERDAAQARERNVPAVGGPVMS